MVSVHTGTFLTSLARGSQGENIKNGTAWILYSVGVGFSSSTIACYRSALSVPLYSDVDIAYANILGKSIVLFPLKHAYDIKF